jgi:hypothetical protein
MTLCLIAGTQVISDVANVRPASATSVSGCNSANFWGAYVYSSGEAGTLISTVALINVGHTACRLSGYPALVGYKDGKKYLLGPEHFRYAPFNISPTILTPRMSGVLLLSTSDSCAILNSGGQTRIRQEMSTHTYQNISIAFPDSTGPVYVNGIAIDVACGLGTTELGWQHQ